MREDKRSEGGRKGSTAQQKADRLRSKAERLSRQADAWTSSAEREPTVGRRLSELPREYSVLGDVTVPGSAVHSDHVVVGPGGIYLVDAKKYSGRLVYSGKMLWHGRFPITEKLEAVQWEADAFSEELGRPVVPVLCFVDTVLPQPVTTLGSIIVCRLSSLMTVVRSSHTMIAPPEIERIVEVLVTPTGVGELRTTSLGELGSTSSYTGAVAATAVEAGSRGSGSDFADLGGPASGPAGGAGADETEPTVDVEPRPSSSYLADTSSTPRRPPREPRPPRVRRVARIVVITVIGAVAAAGAVVLFSNWLNNRADETAATSAPTTVALATTTTAAPAPTTTVAAAPLEPQFIAVCPGTGEGWTMVPVWPGTVEGVAFYDYAVQSIPDGAWVRLGVMTSPDAGPLNLPGLAASEQRIMRVTPALRIGTAGEPMFTLITAPADTC